MAFYKQRLHSQRGCNTRPHWACSKGHKGEDGLIYSQSLSFPFSKSLQARCSEWEESRSTSPHPRGLASGASQSQGFRHLPGFPQSAFFTVQPFWGGQRGIEMGKEGNPGQPLESSPPTTSLGAGLLRCSLSASSRQLRCIAYSCSRVKRLRGRQRRSSSDFIHSWYLQGQREPSASRTHSEA